MRLTKEDRDKEIDIIEKRSLYFLAGFISFWSTILYLIIRELSDAGNIIWRNFLISSDFVNLQNSFGYGIFLILITLISMTLILLIVNSIPSRVRYNKLETLHKEKESILRKALQAGTGASFLLIIYLFLLYFYDNQALKELFDLITPFFQVITLCLFQLVSPAISFILNGNTWWGPVNMFLRVQELVSIATLPLLLLFYIKPEIFTAGELVTLIYAFLITLVFNSVRFTLKINVLGAFFQRMIKHYNRKS